MQRHRPARNAAGTPIRGAKPPQTFVILSAKDGKILERLPLAGSSDGAVFNPATMEAFSTQGNGTMTIVKEKSPTSFEVEQDLKTWPSNGARTIAFDSKTGHLFAMASEVGPPPPPPPAGTPPPTGARRWPRRRDPGLLHDHHGRQIGAASRERALRSASLRFVQRRCEPHRMHHIANRTARRLCGGLIRDERVVCVGHDAAAAVGRQCRHPVLQRQPSRRRITCTGDDHQRAIAEGLKRSGLRQRRGQLRELVAQAARSASGRDVKRCMSRDFAGKLSKRER